MDNSLLDVLKSGNQRANPADSTAQAATVKPGEAT
jgi:hypothetical protein